jgi:hypothetical protein
MVVWLRVTESEDGEKSEGRCAEGDLGEAPSSLP